MKYKPNKTGNVRCQRQLVSGETAHSLLLRCPSRWRKEHGSLSSHFRPTLPGGTGGDPLQDIGATQIPTCLLPSPLLPQPLSLCVCLSLSLPLSFSPLQPRTCSLQRKLSTNTHWGCPTPGSVPDVPLPRIWVSFCIRFINNKDAFLFVLFLKWSTNSIKRKRCYLLDSLKPPPSRTPRTDSLKRPIK